MSGSEEGSANRADSEDEDGTGLAISWPSLQNPPKADREMQSKADEKSVQTAEPKEAIQLEEESHSEEEEEDWEGFSPREFVGNVTERAQGLVDFFRRKRGKSEGEVNAEAQDAEKEDSTDPKRSEESERKPYVPRNVFDSLEDRAKEDELAEDESVQDGNDWFEEKSEEFDSGLFGRRRVRLMDTMEDNERFRPSKWSLRKAERADEPEDPKACHHASEVQEKNENDSEMQEVSDASEEAEPEGKPASKPGQESDETERAAAERADSMPGRAKAGLGSLLARFSIKGKSRKTEDTEEAEATEEIEETEETKAQDEIKPEASKRADSEQSRKLDRLLEAGQSAEMEELPGTEENLADGNLPREKQKRKIGSLQESEQEKESEEEQRMAAGKEKLISQSKSGKNKKTDRSMKNLLQSHGIGGREMAMLVTGAILAVLLLVLLGKAITGMIADSNKSENVTADKGLRVLVEEEPTSWSNMYPVKLKFRVSGSAITEIRINGTICTADEQGIVTYEANNGQLEAEVDTDKNTTLKAAIEIPMLDGEAPVVHAVRKQSQIELTASDARSTVTGIYYAVVDENAMMDLPEYQKYSGGIDYTENAMYYFYAEDAAGNCSVPIATNMETASKLVLEQETVHLYPGGSAELMAEAEPSGALLDNLQYESLNPDILSVSKSGTVTALAKGTGSIKVSADGVEDVICTVTVSDTKTVTISTLGDCTLGTDANFSTANSFNAYAEANGHDYFFKNVKSILEEDDVTFANLEGTFTTSNERADKQFAFKGDLDYTEILTDGSVEVVTLANNHSGDYGEQGLADTKTALEEAGIDYCIGDTITVKEINGIKVAFIGIFVNYGTDDSENQLRSDIENAKNQGAELIITAFHWGSEKATQPDETQRSLAHTAIDCGADLVVGHHPHVLQGIEKYNGKYIAYSLGNFCFGGNSNPSDMDTMIFRQTFTISEGGAEDDDNVTVIPCRISSDQGYNNYQPTPAEGQAAAAIISRLNEYSAAYGVTVADDGSVSDAA